jgi:imidazolonepropionase-like amidohydrolase
MMGPASETRHRNGSGSRSGELLAIRSRANGWGSCSMRRRNFWVLIGILLALIVVGAGAALSLLRIRHIVSGLWNLPERISRADVRALGGALRAIGVLLPSMLFLSTAIASADPAKMWIVGATVISPERPDSGQVLQVLIDGDRIAAVAPAMPADIAKAALVHAEGRYLIPGLMDSHVHLTSIPAIPYPMRAQHPDLVEAYLRQVPRSFLRYGYTTVVDLIVTDPRQLQTMRAAPAHPDIYDCGGALPVPNGYPSQNVPAEYRFRVFPNTVVDPAHTENFPASEDSIAHTPRAAVERILKGGGICVKTFFERGFGGDRNLPVPSADLMREIVAAAAAARVPVLLHASSIEAQTFGLENGISIFAHGLWNWSPYSGSESMPPEVQAVLDRVVERSIGYQATLQVIAGLQLLYDPGYLDHPGIRRVIPPALLTWYRSDEAQWYKRDLAQGATDAAMSERYGATLRRGSWVVKYLAQHHARFLFGTDTPSGPTIGNLPGLNGYLEMRRLVDAGLSLRQLLEAATISNAKAFGLDGQIGTVQPGKRANLVLLGSSPLESVQAYDSIQGIWVGGKYLLPGDLEADRQ